MYRDHKIGLVIPAYREERLIGRTLEGVPPLIDRIYPVDDCSPDGQNAVILARAQADPRISLLKHEKNRGPGAAIITGYRKAFEENCDIVVVVGGDSQMDLAQVEEFLNPIVEKRVDYTKGNRFLLAELENTVRQMPKIRLIGNWIITGLTKVASGYFKVMDVVDGYTAISRKAIATINWDHAWQGYGYPMDFLVRLNAYGFKIQDIQRKAIYLRGERQSQIKGLRYALRVSPMLIRDFFWRLRFKYLYLDFHPLFFCYMAGLILIPIGGLFGLYLVMNKILGSGEAITASRAIFVALLLISGLQFLFFGMLFDTEQ